MGTLFILTVGLIGGGSGFKRSFTTCWIFLINLAFALYISIFLAPFIVSLLEIPRLDPGYKNAIALGSIFIVADNIAVSAMYALLDMGVRIPDDLSIIGFDGMTLSRFVSPVLTTIRQPVSPPRWRM